MKKLLFSAAVFVLAFMVLAGCSAADVVLKYAPGSFQAIAEKYPNIITDTTETDYYYTLSVDGETKLHIRHDYSLTGAEDIIIETPLKPFSDAGLDAAKLGEGYRADADRLYLTADYGSGSGMKENVTDSLFEGVRANRRNLSYHESLDHYGVSLAQGKFEWAKDYTKNDKDIVFVLLAKPLKDIGVDVNNVQGWVFMAMDNPDGSKTDVLVKPADLDTK